MLLLLLTACGVMPYHRPITPPPAPEPTAVGTPSASIAEVLAHVDRLLAVTDDVDRRDRLVELRDLLVGVQLADPRVQERVVRFAERTLAIEDRAVPLALAESPMEIASTLDVVTEESVPEVADPLAAARVLLAEGHLLDAVAALDALEPLPAAAALRRSTVDRWAAAEREAAGEAFVAAMAMPSGPARTAAILAVRDRLVAINTRFPDNAYAADVAQHLVTVEKELPTP